MNHKDVWEHYQSGIFPGSNVEEVLRNDVCMVYEMKNDTGKGSMTVYQILDGVFIMFNDFNMRECTSEFRTSENLLCIDHCREGKMQQIHGREIFFMEEGDIFVDTRKNHDGFCSFPSHHYHGVSIGFKMDIAQKSIEQAVPGIPVELKHIKEKFCRREGCRLIRKDHVAERIFYDLYRVPGQIKQRYFLIKVLELLVYMEALKLPENEKEHVYFYVDDVEKVKIIWELLTENLSRNYSLKELSKRFGISETAMKRCFKEIFGDSIHAYIKKYRMNYAATLLKTNTGLRVSDIALSVGYETPSKFSAAFKSVVGYTPTEYRKYVYLEPAKEQAMKTENI